MKIGTKLMKINVETAIDVFKEDFKVLIKEEPSLQFKQFEKDFKNTINLHNEIENISDENIMNTHKKLNDLFWKYLSNSKEDIYGISRAYNYYLLVYKDIDFEQCLKEQGINVNCNEIFLKYKNQKLMYSLYNVRSNQNTINIITKLGEESRSFFEDVDDFDNLEEEKVDDIHDSLFTTIQDYIKGEIGFYNFLNTKFKNNSIMSGIEEVLYENIEFVYENLLFYISHYGISQGFEKFNAEFNHDELLKITLSNDKYKDLKGKIKELIDKKNIEEPSVFQEIEEISNRFYCKVFNNLNLHMLAEEIREQMIEVVTDCIWEEYPNGDLNGTINLFASFTYLYKYVIRNRCNISEFCYEELDLDRIFAALNKKDITQEDTEKFEKYLSCIYYYEDKEKLDQAIDIFPEYEFPYYYKLLNLMKLAEAEQDLSDIPEQEWLNVDYYLNKLKYLQEVLSGDVFTTVFPTLSGSFIDFANFMLKIDIGQKDINPMKRIFSTFKVLVDLLGNNIEQKRKIEKLNKSLEESLETQNDIVSNYSHAWKHVVFPNTVKDIAVSLIKDFDSELNDIDTIRKKHKEYSVKLMKAYRAESIMKRQGELLVLKHSADNESLQNAIRSDILRPNSSEEGVGIQAIMEESLETLLFEIIMKDEDASNTDKSIRNKLFNKEKLNILREDFSRKFILNEENYNILEWISEYIYPVQIKEIDENWINIKMKTNGNATVFFIDIFTELIYNALKYGKEPDKGGFINLSFTTVIRKDKEYLEIKIENPKDLNADKFWGTGSGIKSLNRLINKVNFKEGDVGQERFVYGEGEAIFTTKVQLIKNMFVKRRRRRRTN